jgi:hypothetical protein
MKTVARWSLLAVSLVALGACNRDRERSRNYEREQAGTTPESERSTPNEQDKSGAPGSATLTGAAWVANDAAIDRVVAARCAREITCNAIGPDKHFTSGDACVREVGKKTRDDLKSSECPAGIDGKELDECLDAIRNESCNNPIDVISRLSACRTSELCIKPEMPHR